MSTRNPQLLGRSEGDSNEAAGERAETVAGPRITIPFVSGAQGDYTVEVFTSKDDEDRGGVVIRLSVKDHGSSFVPAVVATPTGIEIHQAGDAEASCLVRALRGVLAALAEPRFRGD